jgi:anthraniloyl-CoA monooxygenase
VKIGICGGGPAGLYFAILMKRSDPGHQVAVYERNASDDTFGWGVVFSEETLGNLEEADPETYAEIAATFAKWGSIDIFFRGERIRTGGHDFCGIERKTLLKILQARAEALGVETHFRTEVEDLDRFEDCDLIVAADGINSGIRERFAADFRPDIDVRSCKFIWLGSTRPFEAFTFFFRENDDGFFQVHAYQFDAERSTFIVECDEDSWRSAGLDHASTEETVAYLERLFEAELEGHRLLTNKSEWINFRTIRNEKWYRGNVALMGDAAHTAHYSIGSGTKLAMEDAICLERALREESSLPEALEAYERERKWDSERLQRAAQDSLEWFETVKTRKDYEPAEFAYSLMTRSRRLVHDGLFLRDEAYVREVNRWFANAAGVSAEPAPPPMFTPFTLRGLTLENRVVCSPMCMYSAEDGTIDDFHLVHLGSRAIGGAGLVIAEMTDVSREGRITPGCAGMYKPEHVGAWRRVVDFIHRHSRSRIGLQLAHAGRKGSTKRMWEGMNQPLEDGWPLLAPSALPFLPESPTPRAMERGDMESVRAAFVRAAEMADSAGFDLIEIQMAHGYLLSTFLSPLTNRREDEYGGSLENRMRYPLEIFRAVRAVWPEHKPISVRISAVDWVDGGQTIEDSIALARALKGLGCDVIDVSSGYNTAEGEPEFRRCFQVPFSERIRKEAGIPTIAVGAISKHGVVNSILAAGQADLCAMARPLLFDPYFTLHAAAEQEHHAQPWPAQYGPGRPEPREKLPWLERERKRRGAPPAPQPAREAPTPAPRPVRAPPVAAVPQGRAPADHGRQLLRIVAAGFAVLLAGFLPWVPGGGIGWGSWVALSGMRLPSWLVLLAGLFLLCAAFLQWQKAADLSWKTYFGGACFGFLYSLVFLFLLSVYGSPQIGPVLAFAGFTLMGVSALGMRPKEASLARRVKRRPAARRRLKRRKRRR